MRAQLNDPSQLNSVLLYTNPSVCLHSQYLRPNMQATCAKLFSQKDYDVTALKTYLQDYLIVSFRNTPCLYLDINKQVKGLGFRNSLCQSLLKPIRHKGWFLHDEGH
ncbi:hypothetical protein [Helicobacter salomonis]|uniref:hypothetical protein n=1 Tax=Helicobacter salomonis TaxID=56878 RepID=UPI000CF0581E|nr:hypothetical protein [Helicobacter salomonis]